MFERFFDAPRKPYLTVGQVITVEPHGPVRITAVRSNAAREGWGTDLRGNPVLIVYDDKEGHWVAR